MRSPRFRKHGAKPAQSRGGRRGYVFSVRLTDEERQALESLRVEVGGPRSLGPWLVWAALRGPGNTRARVLPPRAAREGSTAPGQVVPIRKGTTAAAPIVLDLCGGSGAWSKPYRDAGYDVRLVTLPDHDVREFKPPSENVRGVLAAPPCDQFSLARNGHPDLPRDFDSGLEPVTACLRIIATARPKWWALENPVGMLSRWLGTPRLTFEPCDYGDPWTKRTALWGDFAIPERGPFVDPIDGGGPLCVPCNGGRKTCHCSEHRAITPPGFARAFFEANP